MESLYVIERFLWCQCLKYTRPQLIWYLLKVDAPSNIGENTEAVDNTEPLDISASIPSTRNSDIEIDINDIDVVDFSDLLGHEHLIDIAVNQYVGGYIVSRVNQAFNCDTCTPLLSSDTDPNSLIKLKEWGTLHYPSTHVTNIIQICNLVLKKEYDDGTLFLRRDVVKIMLNKLTSMVLLEYPNILKSDDCKYFLRVKGGNKVKIIYLFSKIVANM